MCATKNNVIVGFADGTSKAAPAPSCQHVLDGFGLKTNTKVWILYEGVVVQATCVVTGKVATVKPNIQVSAATLSSVLCA